MTNVSSKIDLEVYEWFDADGTLMIDVYAKGADEPIFTHEVKLSDMVKEFIDINASGDGLLYEGEDEEQAEEMVDEFQYCIDLLNDSLRDYEV